MPAANSVSRYAERAGCILFGHHLADPFTPITETIAVTFSMEMNWLPIGGMMMRNACGITTQTMMRNSSIPSARAASLWPRPTPNSPERMISAI